MQCTIRHARVRPALTLMELIVVLVILIGLAGILVPMFPSMLTRTHTSSAATNMQEIIRLIGTYEQLNFQYPDGWDTLTDGTNIVSYVPTTTAPAVLQTKAVQSSDPIVQALATAGIQTVYNLAATVPASQDPTFNPYNLTGALPTPTLLKTSGTTLVTLTQQGMQNLNLPFNLVNNNAFPTYVVFGLGKTNTMIGKVAPDVPVHFSDDPNQGPQTVYGRFGVIFRVTDNLGNPLSRAVLAGACDFSADHGVSGIGGHIQEYYQAAKGS